jgi:hypothetical protein
VTAVEQFSQPTSEHLRSAAGPVVVQQPLGTCSDVPRRISSKDSGHRAGGNGFKPVSSFHSFFFRLNQSTAVLYLLGLKQTDFLAECLDRGPNLLETVRRSFFCPLSTLKNARVPTLLDMRKYDCPVVERETMLARRDKPREKGCSVTGTTCSPPPTRNRNHHPPWRMVFVSVVRVRACTCVRVILAALGLDGSSTQGIPGRAADNDLKLHAALLLCNRSVATKCLVSHAFCLRPTVKPFCSPAPLRQDT